MPTIKLAVLLMSTIKLTVLLLRTSSIQLGNLVTGSTSIYIETYLIVTGVSITLIGIFSTLIMTIYELSRL